MATSYSRSRTAAATACQSLALVTRCGGGSARSNCPCAEGVRNARTFTSTGGEDRPTIRPCAQCSVIIRTRAASGCCSRYTGACTPRTDLPATIGIRVFFRFFVRVVVAIVLGGPPPREIVRVIDGFTTAVFRFERCLGVQNTTGLVGIFAADRETDGVENRHGRNHTARGVAHDGGRDVVRFENQMGHRGLDLAHVLPQDDHFVITHSCLRTRRLRRGLPWDVNRGAGQPRSWLPIRDVRKHEGPRWARASRGGEKRTADQ